MSRVNPFKRPRQDPQSRPSRVSQKLAFLAALFVGSMVVIWGVEQFLRSPVYGALMDLAFVTGESYERWFNQQAIANPVLLMGLAFVGGLVASISPCILSLLPVNLTYIGTREITSRRAAIVKASAFVLGVVTILSLLGLFSALAGFVFVQFRGYFHLIVGTIIVLMGLSLAGVITLPLPQNRWLTPTTPQLKNSSRSWPARLRSHAIGPFSVGVTFALVSSPCTSPVMVSVLAAGAATGSQLQSMLAMVSYALGYTMIIFLASVFTGLAKQTRGVLAHADAIARVASLALLLVGMFYLISGGQWVLSTWQASM
ncbi:MAG: cytochrome c biogenesis protein CcdA [Leptolyngbyaceae cyanobacterium bins.349]|nr:cytochrome c biogenesis protein CcdA [Leptolyngbyaceae cyanobacterium bins.349]